MYSIDRLKSKPNSKPSLQQYLMKQQTTKDENLYQIKENNMVAKTVLKSSKKLINDLTTRINRAMKDINNTKNYQQY